MIFIKNNNIRIQVTKLILDEVLTGKRFHLELDASKHWKKELIDVKIVDDELVTTLVNIKTITISNGLHASLPTYDFYCIRYFLDKDNSKFVFQFGDEIQTIDETINVKEVKSTKQLNLFN